MAVLKLPSVLLDNANAPVAVFSSAMVLCKRAAGPTAVLLMPVVLNKSAAVPNAVLPSAVFKRSAPAPAAVLKLPAAVLRANATNRWIRSAGGEALKGVLSFCRCEIGIASVWRRDHCLRSLEKPNAENPDHNVN